MMGQRVLLAWGLGMFSLLLSVLPRIPAATPPGVSATGPEPDLFASLTSPVYVLIGRTYSDLRGPNITAECKRDVANLMNSSLNHEQWALRVLDSVGKPSSGIMEGGLTFPGYFSECVTTQLNQAQKGKYCLTKFDFTAATKDNITQEEFYTVVRIGVCVPPSCTSNDVNQAISSASVSLVPGSTATIQNCYEDDGNLLSDAAALVVIFLVLVFFVLALVGTMLDLRAGQVSSIPKESAAPDPCSESKPNAASSIPSISFGNNASSEALYRSKPTPGVTLGKILRCFSLIANAKKLLDTSTEGQLDSLHGIRFLSMAWIITCHSFSFAQQWLIYRNPSSFTSDSQNLLAQGLANGTFSVDTFFFLSGFLVAYLLLRELKKNDGRFSIFHFYLHRYIRLTPLMMMVIAISATLLRHLGTGPMWKDAIIMYDSWCRQNWWLNALYLQNFINREQMCLSHTWFSAVDMQMYLVAPIIIYLCYRHAYLAIAALGIPLIITSALPLAFTLSKHLPAVPNGNVPEDLVNEYFALIYVKPYCRMGPYLVGIWLAYFLYKNNGAIVLGKKLRVFIWVLAASVNVAVIFSMGRAFTSNPPTDAEAAMYNGLARTAWAVTIAWIAFACTSGYAEYLNRLLSMRALIPFSRLTYSAYLIHPVLIALFYGSREMVFDYSLYMLIYLFLGNLVITFTISFVLSLLFESPIIAIEKILRRRH